MNGDFDLVVLNGKLKDLQGSHERQENNLSVIDEKVDSISTRIEQVKSDLLNVAEESTSQEIKTLLVNGFNNTATKNDFNLIKPYNCVTADLQSTNLIAMIDGTPVSWEYASTKKIYVHCPYNGKIKIEATATITNSRSSSAHLSIIDYTGTVHNFLSISSSEKTKTGSIVIPLKANSDIILILDNAPRYDAATLQSVKLYGTLTQDNFMYIKTEMLDKLNCN